MSPSEVKKTPKKENPLKPKRDAKSFIKFLLIAAVLLLAIDFFVFKGERPYATKMKADYHAEQQAKQNKINSLLPPKVVYPENGDQYFEAPENFSGELESKTNYKKIRSKQIKLEDVPVEGKTNYKKIDIQRNRPKVEEKTQEEPEIILDEELGIEGLDKTSKAPLKSKTKPKIAIVIDDVGMNIKQSNRAIDLPSGVTLAMLPYAPSVQDMAHKAKSEGHELIIHAPMEALSNDVPLGPMALMSEMDYDAFHEEFDRIANSFEGYSGVNNLMGSLLTQDSESMGYLMDQLKRRGLYFLDSRTIHTSVAEDVAGQYEVPHAVRDVFLDHEETADYTNRALQRLERIARQNGAAIAIGHPKAITMDALHAWIPTLEAKGFELVPVSTLVKQASPSRLVLNQSRPQQPE